MNSDNAVRTDSSALVNAPQKEHRWFLVLVLAFLCLAIAITNTYYVGDLTIYHDDKAGMRLGMHDAIHKNEMPNGGWVGSHMNRINLRIFTIYLSETIHDLSGFKVRHVYRFMDLVFITTTLFLSFFFFRSFTSTSTALIGLLYLAWILPLTYAFHNFQPWDRIGWLTWLLAIWAIKDDKLYTLAPHSRRGNHDQV